MRRRHLSILGLYSVLALALTWPLTAQIATRIPGVAQWAFDESTFVWNIWYFKHALVDNLASPLHTELIWYPLGIDLILYTYNFFHALLAQPGALAVNYPFGSNLTYLLSTILSGYGTFLLVYYLMGVENRLGKASHITHPSLRINLFPPVLAGLLYAFASNRAIYATLGHYDMTTTQWIPFYALMLLRSLDGGISPKRRRRAALLAGLFFAWNGLAEMITALFLAIFTGILVIIHLTGRSESDAVPKRQSVRQALFILNQRLRWILLPLTLTGITALLLWSPALLPILRQFLTNDFSLKGWGEAIPLSTDLLGWFTPTVLHPLWGGDLVTELRRVQLRALELGVTGFRDVNTVFLGWTSLGLALLGGLAYRRRLRLWIWTAGIFGLFTLGPFLQIGGQYRFDLDGVEATFPLPFALLHYIPIIKANRAPNRNSVLLMLGLAVLAGYGMRWLLAMGTRSWARAGFNHSPSTRRPLLIALSLLLCTAVIVEHLAWPLPLSDARVPEVYKLIAQDDSSVSVLNVPLGWRNSFGALGPERTQLQYFQTVHGKPMLGGNISRAPDFKMDYFARIPYFDALIRTESGSPVSEEELAQAADQGAQLMALYNTGYVILHPPIAQRYPYADHWQAAWDFVKQTLPLEAQPFWHQEGIEAYRVIRPPLTDQFRLDLGTPGTFPYRGEGWDEPEVDTPYGLTATWATARTSRLFIPLDQVQSGVEYTLVVQLHPFAYGGPEQTVGLRINGAQLAAHPLADGWQETRWQIPGTLLVNGLNRLTLNWAYAVAPRTVLPGQRTIGSTGVTLPLDVEIKSFSDGAFIALFDEAGNQSNGSAGRQGVNVTVLDPEDGAILAMQGFDTTANAYEDQALVHFLQSIDPGQIVLVATQGRAGAYLSPESVTALGNLGADLTLAGATEGYFSVIGVQGVGPGRGVTVAAAEEAFLPISLNRDRRTLAGAVDWIAVTRE